ncbi:MAG: DUF1611 domain-containing protein [Calditrichaceae bacterium]|jgi:uncharacterized NAD-dependent epimerase/dehydratase family protein
MTAGNKHNTIVYCEGAFNTPNGKTAHGLVRFTERYNVLCVIDSKYPGQDSGSVIDNKPNNIPVVKSLAEANNLIKKSGKEATHFVIGLAPDGGRLGPDDRKSVIEAINMGLNIDCGLHDFLSDDTEIARLAESKKITLRDIRKPPERKDLHFFSGKIEEVRSFKIALLGTDSAVGKRTTAWMLVHALQAIGLKAELIGTGQTAWMQGARYSLILDSLVNDFVSGEIEHTIWKAWKESKPDVLVLEGQGSLMNPAYPGGFELLAAGRPDVVVLQHAPARLEYDGFPGYFIQPLPRQIEAVELISGKPVIAITINHENMNPDHIIQSLSAIGRTIGLPAYDVLLNGAEALARQIGNIINRRKRIEDE